MLPIARLSINMVCAIACTLVARAAVVELDSGETVTGTITKKTDAFIDISVLGETKTYKIQDIKEIRGRKPTEAEIRFIDDTDYSFIDFKTVLQMAGTGDYVKARDILQRLKKNDPVDTNIIQALKTCDDVLTGKISRDYAHWLLRGAEQMLDENYDDAISSFNKALVIKPESTEIYFNLASAYRIIGRYEEAVAFFRKLYDIEPYNQDVLYGLAESLYLQKKYAQAAWYFEKLIPSMSNDAKLFAYIGSAYQFIGEHEKANPYLKKAISLYQLQGDQEQAREVRRLAR